MKLGRRGFTLIELVIVLVVIGILAAVAIPRYADIQQNARLNSVRGTCGNVRSAISIAKANNLVNNNDPASTGNFWPSLTQLQYAEDASTLQTDGPDIDTDPDCPLDSIMPENPFVAGAQSNNIAGASVANANARNIVAGGDGWAYCETNGIFYANSNTDGENLF